MKGVLRGYKYLSPQKLAVTGRFMHLSELPTLGRNFRCVRQAREPFAGTITEVPKGVRTSNHTLELPTE